MRTWIALLLSVLVVPLLLMLACKSQADPAAGYPSHAVELVTHNPPGGALDTMARLVIEIAQSEKALEQPLTLVTKAGSSGAATFGYLVENKGDPYRFMIQNSSILVSTPLVEDVPYTYRDFVPIANMLTDAQVLMVRADSPWKTIDDLIEEARKRPNELSQAMTNITTGGPQTAREIMAIKGVKWKLVNFATSSEGVLAVLNGTVDFVLQSPIVEAEHVRAGKARVLLTSGPKRYPGILDCPTTTELKLGTPHVINRSFFGPPQMPDYAVKKLEAMLKKVYDTPKFKAYADETLMQMNWTTGSEFAKVVAQEEVDARKDLESLGQLKKK